ncbi:Alba DNA/RNA-binding protein [Prunus dulcis]|uniref:Alba DNA/RNA-binding protein n=1 Tax=Prunus dulcis TaxID=3755 RepID=A0A4Y1RMS5_PRUDU|nr:Alba DNA/RNA-binding protein [Prunus dulcis]
MDKFQRVEKPKAEAAPINENEIRITAQGRMRNYITYATTLLQEKGSDEIILKAMGRAINKTVMIAELIKLFFFQRRIVGLHQNTSIGSTDITDVYEPLEEGLDRVESTRHVSMITITLSKTELHTSSTGYQPPLPADQVKPLNDFEDNGGDRYRVRLDSEAGVVVAEDELGIEETTMELGIIMEMVGMVGVVMVAEVEAVEEVVLLGDEEEVMVSRVDTMTMLKVHLPKVAVSQGVVEAEEEAVVVVVIPDWKDKHPLLEQMFTRYVCGLEKKNDIWDACSAYIVVKFADISMGTVLLVYA